MADKSLPPKRKLYHGGKQGRKCPSKEDLPERPCIVCSSAFAPQRRWHGYCSVRCRDKRKIDRAKAYEPMVKRRSSDDFPFGKSTCPVCTDEFVCTRSRKKYCSFRCFRLRIQRDWKNKNRASGKCYACSKPPLRPGSSYCKKHWLYQAAWRAGVRGAKIAEKVEALLEDQKYTCPYTERTLVIGENASLDHINPRSADTKGIGQIENLEWVDVQVNLSKRAMTRSEFVEFCGVVHNRARREK